MPSSGAQKKISPTKRHYENTTTLSTRERRESTNEKNEEEKENEKWKNRKTQEKNVIYTSLNLTQDKQLTKHAQKLITAFTKRMSMIDIILDEYVRVLSLATEPRSESQRY